MYRVTLVDPRNVTRATLRDTLRSKMPSVREVEECWDYDLFVRLVADWRPDVAIVALDYDRARGLQLIAELAAMFPGLRIVAVVVRPDAALVNDILGRGASGYIDSPITLEKIQAALEGRPESKAAPPIRTEQPTEAPALRDQRRLTSRRDDEYDDDRPARKPRGMPFPPQLFLPRLVRGLRETSKRLWRYLPFSRTVGDAVDTTVFAPPIAEPGERVLLQVFAHLAEQAEIARDHAREFDAAAIRRGFKSLEADIKRGTKLTFHLVLPGTVIGDPVQHLVWRGEPASVQFIVRIPEDRRPGTLLGTVSVSQDSIPIGHVTFKLAISNDPSSGEVEPVGEVAPRYRKAFISYASPDRPEVLKRVQMLREVGIDFFQDVMKLEPGERWEKQLYREIDKCDLFLLFWSVAARDSKWVLKELQYALDRKRKDDLAPPEIKPVVIEGPPPPAPPTELAHLHFNDYFLYFINPRQTRTGG